MSQEDEKLDQNVISVIFAVRIKAISGRKVDLRPVFLLKGVIITFRFFITRRKKHLKDSGNNEDGQKLLDGTSLYLSHLFGIFARDCDNQSFL